MKITEEIRAEAADMVGSGSAFNREDAIAHLMRKHKLKKAQASTCLRNQRRKLEKNSKGSSWSKVVKRKKFETDRVALNVYWDEDNAKKREAKRKEHALPKPRLTEAMDTVDKYMKDKNSKTRQLRPPSKKNY